jgi:hypothetical protein
VDYGLGNVVINGHGLWALWVRGDGVWKVRMGLDEFAAVGIHEHQRVCLKIPLESELSFYFRWRHENPPFVWLDFGFDVRRR